jgi:beta-lactamase regulating signal transducer with metallopeptidase domain
MNTLEALWAQPVTQALGGALADFVWQGAAIALGVRALLACMGRRPAHERYAVACLGLLVMAVLPVGSFFRAVLAGGTSVTLAAAGGGSLIGGTEVSLATWGGAWLEALRPWLLSAWLCGVLLLSLRTGFAWKRARALAHEGTRPPGDLMVQALARVMERTRVGRPVRLLESVAVEVPTVVGLWRPLILVPASAMTGLTVPQLEAVLAHELAHIRRHDYLVNLLQALVETVLFYHPAVWWLSSRIREEREHCADDVAVESCGDALFYSRALAALEQLRAPVPVPALAANGGSLLLRIQRLLAVPQGGESLHPWRLMGSLAAALLVLVLGVARQAQATGETAKPRFQEGMTRPEKLSGDTPQLTDSMMALLPPQGVLLLVECTITAEGSVTDCAVVNPKPELAELEAESLRVLLGARYKPVTFQGNPLSVRYVFNLRFKPPAP